MIRRTLAATLVAAALASAASAADWPRFQGPNRDGTSPESGLGRSWPPGGPKILWKTDVGIGYGGVAVAGGNLYLLDREAGAADVLRCLDAASGAERLRAAYDAPGKLSHPGSRSVPTVDGDLVFTVGGWGHLKAWNRETFAEVWARHVLADWDGKLPRWGVSQSPLVVGEKLIVAPQSKTVGVVALDKATGRELWRSGPVGEMRYVSPVLHTLADTAQVVIQSVDRVAGVDLETGRILWTYRYHCRNAIPHPTRVGPGALFITGGYDAGSDLVRIGRGPGGWTATRVWRHEEIGSQIPQPFVLGQSIYLVGNTNTRADGMVCLAADGSVRWQTKRDPHLDRGNGVLTADGTLYQIDGASGEIYIVEPSPAGFQPLAKAPLLSGRQIWGPMALAEGKLYARDSKRLVCIDLAAP